MEYDLFITRSKFSKFLSSVAASRWDRENFGFFPPVVAQMPFLPGGCHFVVVVFSPSVCFCARLRFGVESVQNFGSFFGPAQFIYDRLEGAESAIFASSDCTNLSSFVPYCPAHYLPFGSVENLLRNCPVFIVEFYGMPLVSRKKRRAVIHENGGSQNLDNLPTMLPKWVAPVEPATEPLFAFQMRPRSRTDDHRHLGRIKRFCANAKSTVSRKVRPIKIVCFLLWYA